jgi:hypothetical protein
MAVSDRSMTVAPSPDLVHDVAAGEFVFREGDLGTEMYVLHEGQVEILQTIGGEPQRIALLEKGDFFGEMSLLEELPRNATARAVTDAKVIQINRSLFDRMLRDNPEIGVRIMRKLSRRVRETDELLREAMADTASREIPVPEPAPSRPALPAFPGALVHRASGQRFEVDFGRPVGVGRVDPVTGIQPEVDLTPLDSSRSSSRRHARLYRENGSLWLVEEIGTLNGTFVNGARLETAAPRSVQPGDLLRFGLVELQLEA